MKIKAPHLNRPFNRLSPLSLPRSAESERSSRMLARLGDSGSRILRKPLSLNISSDCRITFCLSPLRRLRRGKPLPDASPRRNRAARDEMTQREMVFALRSSLVNLVTLKCVRVRVRVCVQPMLDLNQCCNDPRRHDYRLHHTQQRQTALEIPFVCRVRGDCVTSINLISVPSENDDGQSYAGHG